MIENRKCSIPERLRDGINSATLVRLSRTIRAITNEYPTVKRRFAEEPPDNTKEGLRDFVIEACEDGDGREIAASILLGNGVIGCGDKGQEERSRTTRPSALLSPPSSIEKLVSEEHKNSSNSQANSIASIVENTRRFGKTVVPNYTATEKAFQPQKLGKRKRIEGLFDKEDKRRAIEQMELEQRRMEDEVIWVTNDTVGLAECAQCEKHYEKGENEEGACEWHSGAMRQYPGNGGEISFKWSCCRGIEGGPGCERSAHIDAKEPGVVEAIERKRQRGRGNASNLLSPALSAKTTTSVRHRAVEKQPDKSARYLQASRTVRQPPETRTRPYSCAREVIIIDDDSSEDEREVALRNRTYIEID